VFSRSYEKLIDSIAGRLHRAAPGAAGGRQERRPMSVRQPWAADPPPGRRRTRGGVARAAPDLALEGGESDRDRDVPGGPAGGRLGGGDDL